MGQISLPNGYYIDVDNHSYNLHKKFKSPRVDKKTGKVTESEVVAYYSTLEAALVGFRKRYGRELIDEYEGDMSLARAIELLTTADENISGLIKEYHLNDY